jgi:5-methylthioribose kinase
MKAMRRQLAAPCAGRYTAPARACLMDHELDIESHPALENYLRASGRIAANETVRCRTLAGGVSSRAVMVERAGGEAWVLKQALAKLRVQADWFADPLRVHREAIGMHWLARLAPAGSIVPLVFEDERHHLIAMQAVPQPHENWKVMLLAGRLETGHVRQFAELLATVHRQSWRRRDEVAGTFDDRSFFESLRIEPYYRYSAAQVPQAAAFMERLIERTRATRLALVHGDYSPKNVLVHEGRLVLLDHEVIHWGAPGFDVGFALTHLLSKAHHLPRWRREFARAAAQFIQLYLAGLEDVPWRAQVIEQAAGHALGCLLARVAGRSPLEYLSGDERARQREAVLRLMRDRPGLEGLVEAFVERIDGCR